MMEAGFEARRALEGGDVLESRGAVLVVDDVAANLTAMEALLSVLDCEIVLARSGREALLHLLKGKFAVMLLDVQMPEMDGYEVARYARDNPATRDVPIVFLTAGGGASSRFDQRGGAGDSVAQETELRGYGSGAIDVLFKPANPSVVRSKVRVFLELDQRRRQLFRAHRELAAANLELRETVVAKAALADRFQHANVELERAYHDLKAAQASLIQAAKMASLGELVAGIAHEINNPLAFCVSHLETVKRCLGAVATRAAQAFSEASAARDWERANARLGEMSLGLTRITDLVLKLRTFSRLDEGERKRVNVRESIDAVLTILRHRLEPHIRVKLTCDVEDDIECNPALFNQALMNIVANSIDAISGDGLIEITGGKVDGNYRVAVRDTGSGIDPLVRDRIFDLFFTTKPVGGGTGLGLALAYSIADKHGGTLHAEDAPGGGTRMVLELPLQER